MRDGGLILGELEFLHCGAEDGSRRCLEKSLMMNNVVEVEV